MVFVRARVTAMPWLVSPHDEAATRWWMEHVVLAEQHVRVAYDRTGLLGFAAVDRDWLEHLYVDPEEQGRGVGRRLLEDAQHASTGRLALHVFTRNERARRFYATAGFVLAGEGDGSGNEEREPDCTYTWTAPRPTTAPQAKAATQRAAASGRARPAVLGGRNVRAPGWRCRACRLSADARDAATALVACAGPPSGSAEKVAGDRHRGIRAEPRVPTRADPVTRCRPVDPGRPRYRQ